jgi:hypothetical protein
MSNWKDISGSTSVEIVTLEKGQSILGYYLGSEHVKGKFGDTCLHKFQLKNEDKVVKMWGKTRLDYSLKNAIPVNGRAVLVQVTYLGKVPTDFNPAHSFQVLLDTTQSIPINAGAVIHEVAEALKPTVTTAPIKSEEVAVPHYPTPDEIEAMKRQFMNPHRLPGTWDGTNLLDVPSDELKEAKQRMKQFMDKNKPKNLVELGPDYEDA